MKKYPITWTPIEGLPGCYTHDHEPLLPKDHAVMIQQVEDKRWRVFYAIPTPEFMKLKDLRIASEGNITLTRNPFQVTVTHELGSFNRCKIAGRFYIENYIGETPDDDREEGHGDVNVESTDPRPEKKGKRPPL